MKIKRSISLILTACLMAWLLAGCVNSGTKINWDSYDESTSMLELNNKRLNDKDIIPLQNLAGLDYLALGNNNLSDLSPLASLTNLKTLSLDENKISDLSPLSGLANLTVLYSIDNKISDLTPLENLANLKKLYLDHNQISDLAPLANLANLNTLCISENQISDLAPLANLTSLATLFLVDNRISDLAPLANLTNLTKLSLYGNQVSDLAPLASLTNLTFLSVYNNNNIADWSPVAHIESVEGNPGNAVPLTEATARLKAGQIVYASFDETQSIPSRWEPVFSNESLVRVICTNINSAGLTSSKPGAGGEKRVFYFQALGPGECTIDMYLLSINSDYDIDRISPNHSYTFVIED